METLHQSNHAEEKGAISQAELHFLIGKKLLKSLGSLDGVLKVKVHPVGNDHFRVNVLVGKNLAVAKISNSYFVSADQQGNILESRPKIVLRR
jgi:hypothetical protein